MPKALEIMILVCLPLVWGLAVEFVFSRMLKRRQFARPAGKDRKNNDRPD